MYKSVIGENAGKVWHALNEVNETTLTELAKRLGLSIEATAMAVGWLARENKINVDVKDDNIYLRNESFAFRFG